jgi:hypothetical protein
MSESRLLILNGYMTEDATLVEIRSRFIYV